MESNWKRVTKVSLGFVAMLACATANAQVVVKRVKCADAATEPNGTIIYRNVTGFTQYVMAQVVRESCRPSGSAPYFYLNTTSYTGSQLGDPRDMLRANRRTAAVQREVPDGGYLRIQFIPNILNAKVSGSFDYFIQAD